MIERLTKNLIRDTDARIDNKKSYRVFDMHHIHTMVNCQVPSDTEQFQAYLFNSFNKLSVDKNNISLWSGVAGLLLSLEQVADFAEKYHLFSQINDVFEDQLLIKLKEKIVKESDIDIVSGICGVLVYLQSTEINNYFKEKFIPLIQYKLYHEISQNSFDAYLLGYAHGQLGVYATIVNSCFQFPNEPLEEICTQKAVGIFHKVFVNKYLDDINHLNHSWCHGYAGYLQAYRQIRSSKYISNEDRSQFDIFVVNYHEALLSLETETLLNSSILCHGMSGLLLEIILTDYIKVNRKTLSHLYNLLMALYVDDEWGFKDHEVALKFNNGSAQNDIINGYEGVLLTLLLLKQKDSMSLSWLKLFGK